MKKIIRKLSKRNKAVLIFFGITIVSYIVSFSMFTKNVMGFTGVENLVRYTILIFFAFYLIIYFFVGIFSIINRKYKKTILLSILALFFVAIFVTAVYFTNILFDGLSGFGSEKETSYTANLITLTGHELVSSDTIGMIENDEDIEGNVLAVKLLEENNLENKIIYYTTYEEILVALYNKEIGGAFLPNNYISIFSAEEVYSMISTETIVIHSYTEKVKNESISDSSKGFTEPLTFLFIGVDSTATKMDANAAFNGDTLMVVTFDPETLNTTMVSIPRDTVVPIACQGNAYNKINSSAVYGTECVIDTIENLVEVPIDYYVKINFHGLVDLVEAIGGIEVDVEKPTYNTYGDYKVCEENSDRKSGSSLVCMNYGLQTLDGEQALAYSRNRKQYASSDLARNIHQQQVVEAIVNKLMTVSSIEQAESVFDAISDNIVTNIDTDQIFSAYDILKEMVLVSNGNKINLEKLYLETYNLNFYLPSAKAIRAGLGYYQDSLDDIIGAMKINLNIEKPVIQKEFSFSVNEPYELNVPGSELKNEPTLSVLSSFIGKTESDATTYCNQQGFNCTFTIVDSTSEKYNINIAGGLIGSQSMPTGSLLHTVSNITFYINGQIINEGLPTE